VDLALLRRIETAAVQAWPPTIQEVTPDGWTLRATPGLARGRSSHALTPCRELTPAEMPGALDRVYEFADRYSMPTGIQVSPLSLHQGLQTELDARCWSTLSTVVVLTAPVEHDSDRAEALRLSVADRALPGWLDAWSRCDPGQDVEAHAKTVFHALRGRAAFAQFDTRAVAVAVESSGLIGIFCMAVDPAHRRTGLASALLRALLVRSGASLAYLQVEEENTAARALYAGLGFNTSYRYCHRRATEGLEAARR
jgi:ribosomal protein S18 acetylase RimI-like enzyme